MNSMNERLNIRSMNLQLRPSPTIYHKDLGEIGSSYMYFKTRFSVVSFSHLVFSLNLHTDVMFINPPLQINVKCLFNK